MNKKLFGIILAILMVFSLVCAFGEGLGFAENKTAFEAMGLNIGTWVPTEMPETPAANESSFEKSTLVENAEDSNIEGILSVVYDWENDNWKERGNSLSYSLKDVAGKDKAVFKADLENLLNNSFENAMDNSFYTYALAYIMANNSDISKESASNILNQIIVQMEINKFFPDTVMVSYSLSGVNSKGFNKEVDAKNPVYNGRKYMLLPLDNGYLISSRPTQEPDTIAEIGQTNTSTENQTSILINRGYAWEKLNEELGKALGESFVAGADPVSLLIPVSKLNKGQCELSMTGSGTLLLLDNKNQCWKLESTDPKAMGNALKAVCENFLTLNSYAQIGGAKGLNLKVFFDTGDKTYNIGSISNLADLLTGVYGEPVLLNEDVSVMPTEGDSSDEIEESPSPELSPDPENSVTIVGFTTLEPTGTPAPQPETTATPAPTKEPATQVKVTKLEVNMRDVPGGKIVLKVKRGDIGEVIGEVKKYNGWRWYPVRINDVEGYLRHDCIKELDVPVTITPKPEDKAIIDTAPEETPATMNTEAPSATEALKRGSKGEEVKALQERLIELGYLTGKADGKFGRKTEAAIMELQGLMGMKDTGLADEAFMEKLFSEEAINKNNAQTKLANADKVRVPTKPIITGAAVMKKQYEKTDKGYTTGINLENKDSYYSLTASCLDPNSTTYELKLSFNDLEGASNIDPKFTLSIVNLYIQNVEKIELIKLGMPAELSPDRWKLENGLVTIDFSKDQELLNELCDTKKIDSLRLIDRETSYTVDLGKTSPPLLITKYMSNIWKDMNAATIALAVGN